MRLDEAKEIVLDAAEKSAEYSPEYKRTIRAVALLREWYKNSITIDPNPDREY